MSIDRAMMSAKSSGLRFPHPLSPYTYVRFGEAVLSTRKKSEFFAKIADDTRQTTCGEHNATTLPHSGSSRRHHVRVHGVSSLCCHELFVSEPAVCHPTIPHISVVLLLRAHAHRMPIDRATLGGNMGTFVTLTYIPTCT